jgi:hypothetical protein
MLENFIFVIYFIVIALIVAGSLYVLVFHVFMLASLIVELFSGRLKLGEHIFLEHGIDDISKIRE